MTIISTLAQPFSILKLKMQVAMSIFLCCWHVALANANALNRTDLESIAAMYREYSQMERDIGTAAENTNGGLGSSCYTQLILSLDNVGLEIVGISQLVMVSGLMKEPSDERIVNLTILSTLSAIATLISGQREFVIRKMAQCSDYEMFRDSAREALSVYSRVSRLMESLKLRIGPTR